jgi:Domain of unknown function (DUF4351)
MCWPTCLNLRMICMQRCWFNRNRGRFGDSELLSKEASDFMAYIQDVDQAYESWVVARRAEGKLEGEVALVIKQLTRRVGSLSPDLVARVGLLSLERVEELGVALLDFDCVDDLVGWLG